MRRFRTCIVLAVFLGGCGSDPQRPGPLPSPTAPTIPAVSGFSFTGAVVEVTRAGRRPTSAATVNVTNRTQGRWYNAWTSVDADGRFRLSGLSEGRVAVWAHKDGYVQPCAMTVTITGDLERDVEIVPTASVDVTTIARLQDHRTTFLTGAVIGVSGGVRRPIPNASVGIEIDMDFVNASTRTDESGRYLLCGLPPEVAQVYVAMPGAERSPWRSVALIDFGLPEHRQTVQRDFELVVP